MLTVFKTNFLIFLQKASSPKEITSSDVIVLSEVKPVSEMPNFPSDLEDLMLEPIKSDPNLAPMIQSELIPTPADNIKEEQGDEDMKGNYPTISLLDGPH